MDHFLAQEEPTEIPAPDFLLHPSTPAIRSTCRQSQAEKGTWSQRHGRNGRRQGDWKLERQGEPRSRPWGMPCWEASGEGGPLEATTQGGGRIESSGLTAKKQN